jgi:hypothetical protein
VIAWLSPSRPTLARCAFLRPHYLERTDSSKRHVSKHRRAVVHESALPKLGKGALMRTNEPMFGWCGSPDNAGLMKAAGLDYIEVQLVPLKLEDDKSFENAKSTMRDLPLPALACSYLFPHDARVVGPETDDRRNRAYFDRVVQVLNTARARSSSSEAAGHATFRKAGRSNRPKPNS